MVLSTQTTKKICDFVLSKPRTVQEISELIKKNWRTAERYVERIEEETGSISTRVFRGGTRGALKIVYWNHIDVMESTSFQGELFEKIMQGRRKPDFSPFDIYQFVSSKKKKVFIEDVSGINPETQINEEQDIIGFLKQASKKILVFSGNLSWITAKQGDKKVMDTLRELTDRNVSIKIVSRISMIGADNAKKLMTLNKYSGKELIEVRHRYQPIRAMIVDNKVARFREVREPGYYDPGELDKKIEIFYEIYDKDWVDWLQKVFWKMFSNALPAQKRITEIEKIQSKLI